MSIPVTVNLDEPLGAPEKISPVLLGKVSVPWETTNEIESVFIPALGSATEIALPLNDEKTRAVFLVVEPVAGTVMESVLVALTESAMLLDADWPSAASVIEMLSASEPV